MQLKSSFMPFTNDEINNLGELLTNSTDHSDPSASLIKFQLLTLKAVLTKTFNNLNPEQIDQHIKYLFLNQYSQTQSGQENSEFLFRKILESNDSRKRQALFDTWIQKGVDVGYFLKEFIEYVEGSSEFVDDNKLTFLANNLKKLQEVLLNSKLVDEALKSEFMSEIFITTQCFINLIEYKEFTQDFIETDCNDAKDVLSNIFVDKSFEDLTPDENFEQLLKTAKIVERIGLPLEHYQKKLPPASMRPLENGALKRPNKFLA